MSQKSDELIRTACYCRVSTEEDELLNSLENQVHHYTNYVENRKDLKLVGLYVDKGISGRSKEKRAGFLRMLRHCEEGRIDLIITKSVSRFSRNAQDFIEVMMDLKEKGVDIYFEKENLYTSSPNSTFILSTLAAMAQEEIRNMSQNEEWAWEKRASQGKHRFTKLLGYDIDQVDGERHIIINEKEAAIVREIFALASEGIRVSAIARRMTEKGYVTNRGGTEWTHSTVKSILTNIRYTGDVLSGRVIQTDFLSNQKKRNTGERNQYFIENHHPAIISQKLFEAVQERIKRQKNPAFIKREATNLSGRVFCGVCGSRCYRAKESWLCRRAKQNPGICEGIPLRENEIKEAMYKAMKQRYDLSVHSNAIRLMGDLKRTNDLQFEYHRLSLFYKLEATKQRERHADNDKNYSQEKQAREDIEKEIIDKEKLWQQIEEDRDYRHLAISVLNDPTNIEDDFSFDFMRALFVKVIINPTFEFVLTWFDGTETTVTLTNCSAKGRKLSKSRKKGEENLDAILIKANVDSVKDKVGKQPSKTKATHVHSPTPNVSINQLTKNIDKSPIFLEQKTQPKKKKRVCCYARVSSGDEDSFSSFQFQIVHYTYFIHKNPEWEFAGIYADRGISGTSTKKRTNFNKMIADCMAGKIDMIITKSISRFSRNVIDVST